jgi:hypothetical protein
MMTAPSRSIRASGAVIAGVAALSLTFAVLPGSANAVPTTTTFSVTGGALGISAPASAALGSSAPGTTLTSSLGSITVTDTRANLNASWTATAGTTTFVTGGGTTGETVAKSSVSYASGAATATSGVGVFTPGQTTTAVAEAMTNPVTAFTLTVGTGNNSASWNPTIIIAVPAAAVAGTYTGTITHSVA